MTTTSAFGRQPTKLDYASPTQFKFSIVKLPKVEFFVSNVNIPGITLGSGTQKTPLLDMPYPGDKLTYGDLNMTFLVDENLENYREIHGWLVGLGFPRDHTEFENLQSSGNDRFPGSTPQISNEPGFGGKYPASKEGGIYSDATLTVLTNKNNPVTEVRFRDTFPTSLGGLNYDQQAGDVAYLSCDITFAYKYYEFADSGASSTSVTTS
tara:strand:+ start:340 stop:966 length:627 start_codon:yes stop_codon:yes gene_type:complete